MFARARSLVTEVLDLASRGVSALEGILATISALHLTIKGAFEDSSLARPLVQPTRDLVEVVARLAIVQEELGPARERLEALELSRVRFEAECEGLLLKADGKHNAAKAAEARERQLRKSYAKVVTDPFDENGDGGPPPGAPVLHAGDVQPGEAEGLSPVPVGVALGPKSIAQKAKWGIA